MCGIAGRSSFAPLEPGLARELGARFERTIERRGPDGGGMHHDSDLLLVHRRLAIIDLSEAGAQPLWNEDETVCVVVNGEIYNFAELRTRLESRGHRFRSRSDCEVLVHLYEDGGIDACFAAEGMFAFALWDARSRDLYLVRDRLGIKPLAIAEHDEGVTFGSTVGAILADAAVPRDLRPEALAAVFKWGFVPSPWSAVRAVRRVRPGTWLRVREGRVAEERRWWVDAPEEDTRSDADVRSAIEDGVRSHLVADVPVGALLSAGIDSGLVTCLAARMRGGAGFDAWTVSHPGCAEDEYPEAFETARAFGVALHEIRLGEAGLDADRFDRVVAAMDEPLAISSLVGLHRLFEAVSTDRRVVLSGDGGDELFAGYDWHAGMPASPTWARTRLFKTLAPGLTSWANAPGRVGVVGAVAAHVRRHPASVYLDKLRVATDGELRDGGVSLDFDDPIEATAIEAWDRFEASGQLEQMLAVDRATSLVDEMLAKVDAASMAHSVEARVPLLADPVVRAAKGLAAERKRDGGKGKVCLRDWFRELRGAAAASRPKTGFNSPLAGWLEGDAAENITEAARAGEAAVGVSVSGARPRTVFAAAVVGRWVKRLGAASGEGHG